MKKWLGLLAVALIIAGGWYYLRTYYRVEPSWNEAKFAKVVRSDIRVPITATGIIEPYQKIDIKPEASGQVTDVPVKEGDYVKVGDKLCVIRKEDEQRNVDRAQARVDQLKAELERARASEEAAAASIDSAQARVQNLAGQIKMTEFEFHKQQELSKSNQTNPQDLNDAEARDMMAKADLQAAQVAVISSRAQLAQAKAQIKSSEASLRDAETQLTDAQTHLDRTDVINSVDAVVTQVLVKKGMVVQSGSSSFTGGTPLMTLGDVSQLKVVTRVDEADIGRVRDISPVAALPKIPGLAEAVMAQEAGKLAKRIGKVKLTVDSFPDKTFEGMIERCEPEGRLNTGSSVIQYDVHVLITDERRYILPLGAQATVEFTVENVKDAISVSAEAVKSERGQRGVFIKAPPPPGSNRKFGRKFIACTFGITDGNVTEVVSSEEPLEVGTEVYTKLPVVKDE